MINNIDSGKNPKNVRRVRFMIMDTGATSTIIEAYLTAKLLTKGQKDITVTSVLQAGGIDAELVKLATGIMLIEGVDWITIEETSIKVRIFPAFAWEEDKLPNKIATVIRDEVFGGEKTKIDYFPKSLKPSIRTIEL